jgi:hypothetical protein
VFVVDSGRVAAAVPAGPTTLFTFDFFLAVSLCAAHTRTSQQRAAERQRTQSSGVRGGRTCCSPCFVSDDILCLTVYTWTVFHTFTSPRELQSLTWWLPLVGSVLYGSMIYFGKRIMSTRKPLNPKNAMLVYNVYQSLINGFMAFWLVFQAYRAGFTVWGNYEDHSVKGFNIAFGMWMHYNNKYLELFDTFFMVVKKKDEQISFLHVRRNARIP